MGRPHFHHRSRRKDRFRIRRSCRTNQRPGLHPGPMQRRSGPRGKRPLRPIRDRGAMCRSDSSCGIRRFFEFFFLTRRVPSGECGLDGESHFSSRAIPDDPVISSAFAFRSCDSQDQPGVHTRDPWGTPCACALAAPALSVRGRRSWRRSGGPRRWRWAGWPVRSRRSISPDSSTPQRCASSRGKSRRWRASWRPGTGHRSPRHPRHRRPPAPPRRRPRLSRGSTSPGRTSSRRGSRRTAMRVA